MTRSPSPNQAPSEQAPSPERAPSERRSDVADLFTADDATPLPLKRRAQEVSSQLGGAGEASAHLAVGDRLGAYVIEGVLGSGGQAVVFRARHVHLDRIVALKVPRRDVASRLMSEAKILAKLEHPRIVRVEHVELEGKVPYLVLEHCGGGSLQERILAASEGMPLAEVREIGTAILEALAVAHQRGVVHCDVKPSNVLFDQVGQAGDAGQAKVCDFGIGSLALHDEVGSTMMSELQQAGTPLYMAPEQEDPSLRGPGGKIDGRADLYAFGRLLYAMLTGRKPRSFRPPSGHRAGLDPAWDELVLWLTEERLADRCLSAENALIALRAIEGIDEAPANRNPATAAPGEAAAIANGEVTPRKRAPLSLRVRVALFLPLVVSLVGGSMCWLGDARPGLQKAEAALSTAQRRVRAGLEASPQTEVGIEQVMASWFLGSWLFSSPKRDVAYFERNVGQWQAYNRAVVSWMFAAMLVAFFCARAARRDALRDVRRLGPRQFLGFGVGVPAIVSGVAGYLLSPFGLLWWGLVLGGGLFVLAVTLLSSRPLRQAVWRWLMARERTGAAK